jgi:hypothetical protein
MVETSQFEAKKISLRQTKDGHVLSLAIHPDEIPDEIVRDFIGSRYMVVMVRLADDDSPDNRKEYQAAWSVKLAGMLCRDKQFHEFLYERSMLFEMEEDAAAEALCSFLGIDSRAQLKSDIHAQNKLNHLNSEFKEWKNGQG